MHGRRPRDWDRFEREMRVWGRTFERDMRKMGERIERDFKDGGDADALRKDRDDCRTIWA